MWRDLPLAVKLVLITVLVVILSVAGLTTLVIMSTRQMLSPAELMTLRNLGFVVVLVAIAIGVAVSSLVSRYITRRLREVESAAKRISDGDFSQELAVEGSDELGRLAEGFRAMATSLQQTAAHKGSILESIFEGIIIVDYRGQILEFNPASERMFGLSRAEAVTRKMTDLIVPQSMQRVRPSRRMSSYLSDGEGTLFGQMIEAHALRGDGSRFPIEWAITRISSSEPPVFTVIVHDLTQRKKEEEELLRAKEAAEAASRAKSTFLANMSHELRTPLAAIIGYSELLQEEARDRGFGDLRNDLEKIRKAGQHLLDLITGILDLSKIEAGKMELNLGTFDLADLIDEVLATSQPWAAAKGNTLRVACPSDIGDMHADRTKVERVLLNLLDNAAKFTEQGTITLTVFRDKVDGEERISFRVADTGIGMRQEQVDNLFQLFTQADASIAYQYGGSGLGLAITQRFCELMGGRITVESELGKGSVFTVWLPAVVDRVNT